MTATPARGLDRPGLDALRDAAEAGVIETVWCLTPDRLARSYAYQMLVLDELDRLGCKVHFTDAPEIDDDPAGETADQMQGVIAEYERAKMAERYRRGKLYRVRAGEAIFWKVPYGYRRVPAHRRESSALGDLRARSGDRARHLRRLRDSGAARCGRSHVASMSRTCASPSANGRCGRPRRSRG